MQDVKQVDQDSGMKRLLAMKNQTSKEKMCKFVKNLNDEQVSSLVKLLFNRGKVYPVVRGIPVEYYDETAAYLAEQWKQTVEDNDAANDNNEKCEFLDFTKDEE